MAKKLHFNTVSPLLLSVLKQLMSAKVFAAFRLVGGTGLSLQRGHRKSVDIDLFTDTEYGSVDFQAIDTFLRSVYSYVVTSDYQAIGMGTSYYVGEGKDNCIKLDIFYTTDPFAWPAMERSGIRMASVEEIIAMKLDVISRGGRKKDFWDIHELMDDHSFTSMLALHKKRYPYTHNEEEILNKFTDFTSADLDFDPICLRAKYWEVVKLDMLDFVKRH
jgi:predicted nucleotidyltransferase component of viral defense system